MSGRTLKDVYGQGVFGLPEDTAIPDIPDPDGMVPAKTYYFWGEWTRVIFQWFFALPGVPLWIWGRTGTGKSSVILALGAALGIPVYQFTGSARAEVVDLIGRNALKGGATVWVDGPLAKACRNGGIFLLDEADTLPPDVLVGLNTVLDGRILPMAEAGETVKISPHFRFVATANSVGDGMNASQYAGTLQMNSAFMDRFMVVKAEYLDTARETKALTSMFPARAALVPALVKWADGIRRAGDGEQVKDLASIPMTVPVSMRSLILALRVMDLGVGLERAVDYAVTGVAAGNPPLRTAMLEFLQRCVPAQFFKAK